MILALRGAAAAPTLTDVAVGREGESHVVSCRLLGGLTPERLEEIDAGIETTIGYRLQVFHRRAGLPDPVIAKRRVECSVRHDALTRQYTLTRRIEGELQESKVTADAEVMRDFMTTLRRVPVVRIDELVPGEEYYVKAKSDIGLMWRFYLIPWPVDTAWERVPLVTMEKESRGPRP
jgi:hypothetical protein